MAELLRDPLVHVREVDDEATRAYADVVTALKQAQRSIPSNDSWIAALALREGTTVLTCDPHFADLGLVGARSLRRPGRGERRHRGVSQCTAPNLGPAISQPRTLEGD